MLLIYGFSLRTRGYAVNNKKRREIHKRNKAVTTYRLNKQGLTHNEIAEHLDIKPHHVKSMILLGERLEKLNRVE